MSFKVKVMLVVLLLAVFFIGGAFAHSLIFDVIMPADVQNRVAIPYDTDDLAQSCAAAVAAGRRGSPQCYDGHDQLFRPKEFVVITPLYDQGEGR